MTSSVSRLVVQRFLGLILACIGASLPSAAAFATAEADAREGPVPGNPRGYV